MYKIAEFGRMIGDSIRTPAYIEALRKAVTPGCVVLDIGTGTGIFALVSCQFEARQVYAIEPNPAIQIAKEVAEINGFIDRIKFIQGFSTEIDLPEKVDVIVSDLRGVLPLFGKHISAIIDARQRFLAPGGRLIPQSDTLWGAIVESPELYQEFSAPWADKTYGFDLNPARKRIINSWGLVPNGFSHKMFLTDEKCWGEIEYANIKDCNLHSSLQWTVNCPGTAHGIALWFDATLAPGITYTTSPKAARLVYGNAFMPLKVPVELAAGDQVSIKIQADLVDGSYVWSWTTQVTDSQNPDQIKATFKQSTFFSKPISLESLRKSAESYIPQLNNAGKIDFWILRQMDEGMTIGTLAQQLKNRYPDQFRTYKEALMQVGKLSQQYS
jgi:type I protein arginine methyltransferase